MSGLVHISRIINGLTRSYSKEYYRYLASPEWALKRAEVIRRAGGICERCHKNSVREIHHLTYENFGREPLCDLLGLCPPCHVVMDQERQPNLWRVERRD